MSFNVAKKDRSYAKVSNVLRSCYAVLNLRDHSSADLKQKQIAKGYDADLVDEAIEQLIVDGYVNDEKFARGYFNTRLNKGHGPMRIKQDMRKRMIPSKYVELLLDEHEFCWTEKAVTLKIRKFGDGFESCQKWRGKVWRYLSYRGFTASDIQEALNPHSEYLRDTTKD